MKKEIKDFNAKQLNALADVVEACRQLNYEETEEVLNYCDREAYYFAGKKD